MGLNNIALPDFIIGEWYKDGLLPLTGSPAPAAAATNKPAAPVIPVEPAKPTEPTKPAAPVIPTATNKPATPAKPVPAAPETAPPQTPHIKFLGNNRRNITLLVHSPGSAFLADNQLIFLTKILEACRMTIADVAIVNHAAAPVTINDLRQQLQPKTILLFGIEPAAIRLPINFPAFRPQPYDNCVFLSAPPLDQLVPNTEESKLLKSKLWVCLKTVFDV